MMFMDNHRLEFEHPVVNIIPVIKEVRERFGVGLKIAKDIVDHWRELDQNEAMIAQAEDDTDSAGRPNYLHEENIEEDIAGADDLSRGSLPPVNSDG
jgi:hypothetical protein